MRGWAAAGAGGCFAGGVLIGAAAGLWLAARTGAAWWAIAGFLTGAFLGGAAAVRLLLDAGSGR